MNPSNTQLEHPDQDYSHQAVAESSKAIFTSNTAMLSALFAVVLFSLTAPMSQIAMAVFSPEYITFMRTALAGVCSLMLAGYLEWQLPSRANCFKLLLAGSAVTLIFPYTLTVSLTQYQASDLGIILAGIPLVTALLASLIFKEKQNTIFWCCIVMGTALLLIFTISQSTQEISLISHWSVFVMLIAAGIGYSVGGQVAKSIGGFKTICWMTIFYLPISLLGAGMKLLKMLRVFLLITYRKY